MAESLTIAREIGHRERICLLLSNMGEVAMRQGDDQIAEVYLREAVEVGEAIGPGEATIWLSPVLAHSETERPTMSMPSASWIGLSNWQRT